jgi:hypothetical protein
MNELEWHRQMRALRQPVAPQRDLWTQIDAALDAAQQDIPAQPVRRRRRTWLLAASFAGAAILAGGVSLHLYRSSMQQAATPLASASSITPTPTPGQGRWKPSDPRLAGAAIELDAAQMELRQALKQAPDSVALQRLLERTERQQSQLRYMENQAG